ncbi:MAG: hypothetical protein GEU75_13885 [Dehalococcoidia bacterium]|nr:hypothetical protein [Dehalococcoidia bacterium]
MTLRGASLGLVFLLFGGFVILGASYLSADEAKSPFASAPTPTPAPRPNEGSAMSIAAARQAFRSTPALDAVVKAAEAGDARLLIGMAKSSDVCDQVFRVVPEPCKGGKEVPGVYRKLMSMDPLPNSIERVEEWLTAILSRGPVTLEFASRDSRYGVGNGGEYYLLFRSASPVSIDGNTTLHERVGMLVKPGKADPIQWFILLTKNGNGVVWVQDMVDTARYQVLIAPQSVKDWPGVRELGE